MKYLKIFVFPFILHCETALSEVSPSKDAEVTDRRLVQVVASVSDAVIDPIYREMVGDGYEVVYFKRFVDGEWQVHGPIVIRSKDGLIASTATFKNGVKSGRELFGHDNGVVASYSEYRNGRKVGRSYSWSKGGVQISSERFLNGAKEGVHSYWDESQKLVREVHWSRGKLIHVTLFKNGVQDRILKGKEAKEYLLEISGWASSNK